MKRYILLILSAVSFHCSNPTHQEERKAEESTVTIDTTTSVNEDVSQADVIVPTKRIDTVFVINDTTRVILSEIKKVCPEEKDTSQKEVMLLCRQWHLDSARIVEAIREFRPISGYDLHYGYQTFKCWFDCKVKIGDVPYKLKLNAGSYFYLSNGDTSYIMGDEMRKLRTHFVAGADEENHGN